MRVNVTGYEPAEALFVEDDDPLIFYRAIARNARRLLRPGGRSISRSTRTSRTKRSGC